MNLENGKTVTVIVTKGLDNPGIFLLLSPEAAKVISMEPGTVSRVRVSAPRNIVDAPLLRFRSRSRLQSQPPGVPVGTLYPPWRRRPRIPPRLRNPRRNPGTGRRRGCGGGTGGGAPSGRAEAPNRAPSRKGARNPRLPFRTWRPYPGIQKSSNAREAPLVRPEVLARSAGVPQTVRPGLRCHRGARHLHSGRREARKRRSCTGSTLRKPWTCRYRRLWRIRCSCRTNCRKPR
ncbi:MAG: hypothetical protein MZU97_18915 [Bacillus subtilis]|nr:hypothetical protein [Bacillus subtilis]